MKHYASIYKSQHLATHISHHSSAINVTLLTFHLAKTICEPCNI